MKNFTLKSLILFLLISFNGFGQKSISNQESQIIRCGTDEYNKTLRQQYPNMMGSQEYEKWLKPKIEAYKALRTLNPDDTNVVLTIPVVVHVLHNGEAVGTGPNISDAQVESQISVLNIDYRNLAGSTTGAAADVEIEFCLAQQDPDGYATNGIDRINIGQDGILESSLIDAQNQMNALKPSSFWDASKYMNMWSIAFNGTSGLLGYAQFPGGSANTDGVVSDYRFFGSSDYDTNNDFTLSAPFDLGRTMTHEVGHFLGLFHTFQDGTCTDDYTTGDLCADTPGIAVANYNCPTGNDSCTTPFGNPDMIENYMDYTDDACMDTFTNDQKARIVAIMNNSTNRMELATSTGCQPGTTYDLDGSIDIDNLNLIDCGNSITPDMEITNRGNNNLTSGMINYYLDNETPTSIPWTGNLAITESVIISLPTMSVDGGPHTFTAELLSLNGGTDENTSNNSTSNPFAAYFETTVVNLNLTPDIYGSETTWEFKDSSDTVLYSGGPYTDGDITPINEVFTVVVGECYTFSILDSFNDGICCNYGTGSYELTSDDETVIFSGGEFSAQEDTVFGVNTLSVNDYFKNNKISVFPNPANEKLTIKLSNYNLPDGYKIYNMLGQIITNNVISDLSDLEINTSILSNGMYFVKITKDNSVVTLPFIKN